MWSVTKVSEAIVFVATVFANNAYRNTSLKQIAPTAVGVSSVERKYFLNSWGVTLSSCTFS